MITSTSPFILESNTSPFESTSCYRHPLSPLNGSVSPPPFAWDMGVYPTPEDTNTSTISSGSSGSSGKRTPKRGVSTFITKLYGMVNDQRNQSLISWNTNGASFMVCNATRFAREVLPDHFKHSNFSSFVRQLNMYGFHKINKSLRGQRGSNENEIWEFSHENFRYGRPDLLEDIKRKAMDSEMLRRETGDIHASYAMLQVSHNDLLQQFGNLQDNYSTLLEGFEELKKTQLQQQIILRRLLESTSGQQVPPHVLVTAPQWQPSDLCPSTPDLQYLPPSPAPSDPLGHSRNSSFTSTGPILQSRQSSFSLDSSSNTLGLSISS